MSDTLQTLGGRSAAPDLRARTEPFEVTPDLIAANLSFGGDDLELPDEMMSAVKRIYQDRDFVWPTTVAVRRISGAGDDGAGSGEAWSRISVLGTGFDPSRPVQLLLTPSTGHGDPVALVEATANSSGFFGVDVILRTIPKRGSDPVWSQSTHLALVARQADAGGRVTHSAEQGHLPPHALWQWVR